MTWVILHLSCIGELKMTLGICLCVFVIAAWILVLKFILYAESNLHVSHLKSTYFQETSIPSPLLYTLKSWTMGSNALMETVGFELCSKDNSLLADNFEKVWIILSAWANGEQLCLKACWKHSLEFFFFPGETNTDFEGKVWSEAQTESSPFPHLYTFQL